MIDTNALTPSTRLLDLRKAHVDLRLAGTAARADQLG
jgi:hypothetical protein